ncbi:MAG: glycoside hydrolase family 78 protein [Firmicutes bacterium]|nr:glycoside hydrolase family 78 protein [Bacillota bacterium]
MPDPIFAASWLQYPKKTGEAPIEFLFDFTPRGPAKKATLQATALGVYAATLNGAKVGGEVLAPGWTNYRKRLQYQTYDITELLAEGVNRLSIELGPGWRMHEKNRNKRHAKLWPGPLPGGRETALLAALTLEYKDGTRETLSTGDGWRCRKSKTRCANMYNGETYDAGFVDKHPLPARTVDFPKDILIPLQGERIVETERLPVQRMFTTPQGELVLDFGQVLTGYVEFQIKGPAKKKGTLRHAEILDAAGNFYTANLRRAKQEIEFVCDGKPHVYLPAFTFQGFRYVQPKGWPCEVKPEDFTAVVVHSEMKRTGYFECSEPLVNRLFSNVVWGMRGNFLDVPTDCPQRDERLGWTGDAQVFCRTASYLYDCERFFSKWLADLAGEQLPNGGVPHVIPRVHWNGDSSAGWADAAVICPWEIYRTYGNQEILRRQFDSMRAWVDYMIAHSKGGLWTGGGHFGDWLNLDGKDATPKPVLQGAFFAYSTGILVKAGEALGIDVEKYRVQRQQTEQAFRREFIRDGKLACNTQTACALALHFGLVQGDMRKSVAAQLESLIRACGHLTTGFLGAPYLLHALSENGLASLAYGLLLRREYPSWLYPVTMGATTIWERWDGQRPDGSFQSAGMNSFNHYAYGSVADWLFGAVAGIQTDEAGPGFRHIVFAPRPDARLDYAHAEIDTRRGLVKAGWRKSGEGFAYAFTVPEGCTAEARLEGRVITLGPGEHTIGEGE